MSEITAAEFARELMKRLEVECKWAAKRRRRANENADRQFYYGRTTGFTIVMQEMRNLVELHNIDLSEKENA